MIGTVIFYLIMFAISELAVRRWQVSPEISRTIEHVLSGVVAAALPFWLLKNQIIILSFLFLAFLVISKSIKLLRSLHDVKRFSYGEVLFPLGVGLAAIICLPLHVNLYTASVLILALADPTARLVGEHFSHSSVEQKSNIGSLAFFVVALTIGSLWLGLATGIVLALLATVAERVSPYGLDNVTITAVSLLLLIWS